MLAKRGVCIGFVAITGLALARADGPTNPQSTPNQPSAIGDEPQPGLPDPILRSLLGDDYRQVIAEGRAALTRGQARPPGGGGVLQLAPREPLAKQRTALLWVPSTATGRLIVKFNDAIRARPDAAGRSVRSQIDLPLDGLQAIIQQFGVRFERLLAHSNAQLAQLEARAAAISGKSQPDLAGMMYVDGIEDDQTLLAVAKALNDLAIVEFVEIEVPARPIGTPPGTGPARARRDARRRLGIIDSGDLVNRANEAFNLTKSTIATLEVPRDLAAAMDIEIALAGIPVTLALEPHSVRAGDFKLLEALPNGDLVTIDPGPEQTFRGEVRGSPGSVVAGAVLSEGLVAMIEMADGSRWWVEPIAGRIAGADLGQHVIYSGNDVAGPGGFCGVVDEFAENPPAAAAAGGCTALTYAEIALDLDFPWIQNAGSLTEATLLAAAIVNVVNIQYERDVQISHVITAVVARTTEESDPYTTVDPLILLPQFVDEWNETKSMIRRDVAHLLTGRDLVRGIIGIATGIPALCSFPQPGGDYSLSQRLFPFDAQTDLVAHELGHNWGAVHCPPPAFCPNGTMNPFLTSLWPNKFTLDTVLAISAWRSFFVSTGCLDCADFTLGCGFASAGNCTVANGTPYCNDGTCCGTVCGIEPFCCDVQWDQACADLAVSVCAGCGQVTAGHCLAANATPGCEIASCCLNVTNFTYDFDSDGKPDVDGASCAEYWDQKCAIIARVSAFFSPGCFSLGLEETPDLTAFQAYRTLEPTPAFDVLCDLLIGAPFRGEGFNLDGLWALGEELVGLGVGSENLTRGKTINVANIEDALYPDHEDLDVIIEPGQTVFLNPITGPNHGTATLGIMAASDNGFGVTGIASDATAHFFPAFSLEEGGRLIPAITSAMLTFGPGDVLNFSIGFPFGPSSLDCDAGSQVLTVSPSVFTLIRLGSDLGITSVISAGNQCCNLDTTGEFGGLDSGAMIVAAVNPGFPWCRSSFSNHSAGDFDGGITDFNGWGRMVATTGYGSLFGPPTDPNRLYTMTFNGTSAAAPMVAGAVACLQGLAKQLYGITLMPEQLRDNKSGFTQCGLAQGSDALLGSVDPDAGGGACDGDTVAQDAEPDEGIPNYVSLFPSIMGWAGIVLTTDWFSGSPLLDDVIVLRGTKVIGNVFSIKASDDNYLVVESQFTKAGPRSHPQLPAPVNYPVFGQYADIVVDAHVDIPDVNAMVVSVEAHVTGSATPGGILFVEMFDWQQNFWTFGGIGVLGGFDGFFQFQVGSAARFVRPSDDRVLIRAWTLGLAGVGGRIGGGGANRSKIRVFYDLILLQVGRDFADIDP